MKIKALVFYVFLLFMLISISINSDAQEIKKHAISLVLGHAHISKGTDENGGKKWLVSPAWGLDYNFHINEKWALGLHNDIILEDFSIYGKEEIERNYPFSSCIVGSFKPKEFLTTLIGFGGEFAGEGNYFLCRAGIEFGFGFGKNWECNPSLTYDIKINAYDTWLIGLGVTKLF